MLPVPHALLKILNLRPGAKLRVAVKRGRLIVEPQTKPHYTLDELLALCEPARSEEERGWTTGKSAGGELI
jgi:antitoxin ChpS